MEPSPPQHEQRRRRATGAASVGDDPPAQAPPPAPPLDAELVARRLEFLTDATRDVARRLGRVEQRLDLFGPPDPEAPHAVAAETAPAGEASGGRLQASGSEARRSGPKPEARSPKPEAAGVGAAGPDGLEPRELRLRLVELLDLVEDAAPDPALRPLRATLKGLLDDLGVQPLPPLGERFHPGFHRAARPPRAGAPTRVTAVLQAGWLWRGEVLRPALVEVQP